MSDSSWSDLGDEDLTSDASSEFVEFDEFEESEQSDEYEESDECPESEQIDKLGVPHVTIARTLAQRPAPEESSWDPHYYSCSPLSSPTDPLLRRKERSECGDFDVRPDEAELKTVVSRDQLYKMDQLSSHTSEASSSENSAWIDTDDSDIASIAADARDSPEPPNVTDLHHSPSLPPDDLPEVSLNTENSPRIPDNLDIQVSGVESGDTSAAEGLASHSFFSRFPTFRHDRKQGDLVNFGRLAVMQRWDVGSIDWFIHWRKCFAEDWATTCRIAGSTASSYVEYFARFTPLNYKNDYDAFKKLADARGWPPGGRCWRKNWYDLFGYRCTHAEQQHGARRARISSRLKPSAVRASSEREQSAAAVGLTECGAATDLRSSPIHRTQLLTSPFLLLIIAPLLKRGPWQTLTVFLIGSILKLNIIGHDMHLSPILKAMSTATVNTSDRIRQVRRQTARQSKDTAAGIRETFIDAAAVIMTYRGFRLTYYILSLVLAMISSQGGEPHLTWMRFIHISLVFLTFTEIDVFSRDIIEQRKFNRTSENHPSTSRGKSKSQSKTVV